MVTTQSGYRIAAVSALLLAASVAGAQDIVTLPTRAGVTQSFLLIAPKQDKPSAAAVLFPGGNGAIRLRSEQSEIKFNGGNFLVRARLAFVDDGIAVAVMDAPSDESRGMDDRFRLGEKHSADIAAVVAELKKRFDNVPVFLVGTSRGTISAAAAGAAAGGSINGVVLTSSVYLAARAGPGLSGFEFSSIKAPVLLVHHLEDSCFVTPYREAQKLAETRRYPLVSVKGGLPATSDACEAFSAHGYLGKEKETVQAIANWILQKPYRDKIE
jgi:pimeloyl-ACP methyl ester carboxylesterase